MAVGPTADARRKCRRLSRRHQPLARAERSDGPTAPEAAAFAAVATVSLGGLLAAAVLGEFTGLGR